LSLNQRDFWPDLWKKILHRGEESLKNGINFKFQVAPRAIGVNLGLQCTFHPFMGKPSYKAISQLPVAERAKKMADPELKKKIIEEKNEPMAGDGSPVPPLVDMFLAKVEELAFKLFELDEEPDYEQPMEKSLGAKSKAMGLNPLELVYDTMLKKDGQQLIYFPIYNYTEFNYNNVYTMMTHPQSLPGLSDGGAHVGTVCDASFPTYLISYWTRDRKGDDKLSIETAVEMLTSRTANHMGYFDRGSLEVGKKADINIIDYPNLKLKAPRMIQDLPAGGQRLMQDVAGYIATYVSGQRVIDNGKITGARPGHAVRTSKISKK
jgi:N-acyl-D-aspartate/D-glutamate deacylase